ncbi:sulfurtransferase [Sphingomonas alpina]|uniref:Sulfurtransferase n=1 Tax=Sphingomonas alpina TaxID=653931 RepID=A0A7H0LFU6_9SPHN|nr:sulfurtransferase [Sphingomonas alpina]QNQ08549.1 sulfurtransferase [Sphingomonas alpina]
MTYTCLISVEDLANWPGGSGLVIVDCSFSLADAGAGLEEYLAGHIPGARYLHLEYDLSSLSDGRNGRHPLPDAQVLAATLRRLGLSQGDQVVTYDASGGPFAARAWWLLRWLGHSAVAVLDGGRKAWAEAGLPFEQGELPELSIGDFETVEPNQRMTVDAAEVLASIGAPDALVLDARTASRFRGEANPLDPISGRIPGAANRFYGDNLAADGRFKPPAILADEFASTLDGTAPAGVILQCGSGVTACHNALAMEAAGLRGARLYPGSWSEWIVDPERPRARG